MRAGSTRSTRELAEAHDVDVVARDRKVGRDDRRSARRQRGDQLAFRAHDALERADELEMTGPTFVITPMSGRANAQSSAIWPKPRIASSRMQTSVSGSSRQSVSGTPSSLLKLASAATVRRCGAQSAAGCPSSRSCPSSR